MKNIYVGNLPLSTTTEELKNLFTPHGAIESLTIVAEPDNGPSRGFGFVQMASDQQADDAIKALNGTLLADKQLKVAEARPKRDHSLHRVQ